MSLHNKGEWLSRQMERRGISVRQVADALGVTTKTVYDWQGNKTAISEERVPRLAEILGVSELVARRELGFWVPDEGESTPSPDRRLDEMEALARSLLDLVEEIRRGEPGAAS